MIRFAIIGHRARTAGDFSLSDLPGAAGRMDVLCRCVNAAFFISHDLRRDVECYLVLLGDPAPPKTIRFSGAALRYLNPDERSAGSLIKKALARPCGNEFLDSTPGVSVRNGGLERLLGEFTFVLLDEDGVDIRSRETLPEGFLLSDHLNLTPEEEELTRDLPRVSLGPKSLHGDHAITIVQNELDRRESGWN
jgi:tRNA (pseudouridine54-N1)-methyltransferase